MAKVLTINEKGTISQIASGTTVYQNNGVNHHTKVEYIKFNGQKYGPVSYDKHVEQGMDTGVEMDLYMSKINDIWFVCTLRHVESGEVFTKSASTNKANITMAIMQSFPVYLMVAIGIAFLIFFAGTIEYGTVSKFGIAGLVAMLFWYTKSITDVHRHMMKIDKMRGIFGTENIL